MTTQSTPYPDYVTFADERTYEYSCSLTNGETSVSIQPGLIEDLVIQDTVIDIFPRGYIDIKNPRGALEHSIDQMQRQTYVFRNDSRDLLHFRLMPNVFSQSETREPVEDSVYLMKYLFFVYSVKDIVNDKQENMKVKRLYFVDWRYQPFSKYNNSFTTTAYLTGDVAHWTDQEREIPTGDAIKHLISETIPGEQQFTTFWDTGSSTIDYTSPAGNTSIDDLQELISDHVSEDKTGNLSCLLHLDRYSGAWSLPAISTIFDNAVFQSESAQNNEFVPGSLQSEQFTIGNETTQHESSTLQVPVESRVPHIHTLYFNYNHGKSSIIESFRFVEMNGEKNQQLMNSQAVHSHNSTIKQFNIEQSRSSVQSLITTMKNHVVNNMITATEERDDVSLSINVDVDRFYNRAIEHIHSTNSRDDAVLTKSRNKMILEMLYQSNAIEFTVPGEPTRQSFRFISIEYKGPDQTQYNDKIEGQYFVTSVIHRIKNNMYTNKIIGVKPYNYKHVSENDKSIIEELI